MFRESLVHVMHMKQCNDMDALNLSS